jgi:hypothetical protein
MTLVAIRYQARVGSHEPALRFGNSSKDSLMNTWKMLPMILLHASAVVSSAHEARAEPPTTNAKIHDIPDPIINNTDDARDHETPKKPPSTGNDMRTAGWIIGIGGGTVLAGSLVMYFLTQKKKENPYAPDDSSISERNKAIHR